MTEQQQLAVEIAKDALALLASEKIQPESGKYFSIYFGETIWEGDDVKSTFTTLIEESGECEVCALGAMMLATTLRKNELTYLDLRKLAYTEKSQQMLLTVLTPIQMALIEASFEGSYNNETLLEDVYEDCSAIRIAKKLGDNAITRLSNTNELACRTFYYNYRDQESRFIAIMENIINNQGVFIP